MAPRAGEPDYSEFKVLGWQTYPKNTTDTKGLFPAVANHAGGD